MAAALHGPGTGQPGLIAVTLPGTEAPGPAPPRAWTPGGNNVTGAWQAQACDGTDGCPGTDGCLAGSASAAELLLPRWRRRRGGPGPAGLRRARAAGPGRICFGP